MSHTKNRNMAMVYRAAVVTALALALCHGRVWAQTISLLPDQVPNGIESASGDQFHQRFNILLGANAVAQSRAFTITLPPEISVVANSITTVATLTVNMVSFFAGQPSSNQLAFGLTGTASNQQLTVEFDVTSPTIFTGISEGSSLDTAYVFSFAIATGQNNRNVGVSKHQNRQLSIISFTAPDSLVGSSTTGGGRFFKLEFLSLLPDLSHTGISGLSQSAGVIDSRTDVQYSFYISEDPSLVRYFQQDRLEFISQMDVPPLAGSRQDPTDVPATFIREDFQSIFSDSLEGIVSLVGNTADNEVYYIYVLAEPAVGRDPARRLLNGGGAKSGFGDRPGSFSGGAFLGRSGPLFIQHPPEFVVVGWEYDDDGGDDYSTTQAVQVPSDIPGMASVDENRKDNRNITVDSGSFYNKGDAIQSLNGGNVPDAISTVTFLFLPQDADNGNEFRMNIFLAEQSGLQVADLTGGIDGLADAFKIPGADTLTINSRFIAFNLVERDSITNQVVSFVPEGDYFVYFVATDGISNHRVVTQVLNDPFAADATPSRLSVRHSPSFQLNAFSLNDFGGDLDLDVITGIDVSQMMTDRDGKDLIAGPAQRYVNLFWEAPQVQMVT